MSTSASTRLGVIDRHGVSARLRVGEGQLHDRRQLVPRRVQIEGAGVDLQRHRHLMDHAEDVFRLLVDQPHELLALGSDNRS
jgi:hypothetical protein